MPRVTVVGSVNLDLVASCARLPGRGETVAATAFARYPGGKGANQALAARRAGADVTLIAAVGNDPEADTALALLRHGGVRLESLSVSDHPTGMALIAVEDSGENLIVVVPGANAYLAPEDLDVTGADLVLCQLEIPMETVAAAAEQATGMFCVNTAPARLLPSSVMERADLLIMNEPERDALSDALADYRGLAVVTMGASGAKAYRSGRLVAEAQPPPVEAIDTVGAGDAFCGALVTALLTGSSIGSSLRWACTAGALATTTPGAQPSLPRADQIEAALRP